MDDYKKAYERRELQRAMDDRFLDLFEEWGHGELTDLRRRSIDDELRTGDGDTARMIAVRIAHRLMQVADAIDALNDFDENRMTEE
nr:MAG TPA: hypothetical protein [Bacteriophage sp.]